MTQESEEISKKELLELTGISYGQLYRWKRKGLIPEAWFVKRAAFTGQETFLPRAEILERVERIQGLKDDLNLDALARMLSPEPTPLLLPLAECQARNLIGPAALDLLAATLGAEDPLSFNRALLGWIIDRPLSAGEISLAEGALILRTLSAAADPAAAGQVLLLRKQGVALCLLAPGAALADPDTRVLVRVDISAQVAELKLALNGGKA